MIRHERREVLPISAEVGDFCVCSPRRPATDYPASLNLVMASSSPQRRPVGGEVSSAHPAPRRWQSLCSAATLVGDKVTAPTGNRRRVTGGGWGPLAGGGGPASGWYRCLRGRDPVSRSHRPRPNAGERIPHRAVSHLSLYIIATRISRG